MKKNRLILLMGLLLLAALAITACTATSGQIQEAVDQVAPTLAAAATELAPTVQAAVEEIAPTVEAAATDLAGGEATAEPAAEATEEPMAEEPAGDRQALLTGHNHRWAAALACHPGGKSGSTQGQGRNQNPVCRPLLSAAITINGLVVPAPVSCLVYPFPHKVCDLDHQIQDVASCRQKA